MELAHLWKGYFNNAGTVIKLYRVLSVYIGLPVELVILYLVLTTILIPGHIFITLF
jgi:phage shock protein PspC (stress-responsive transcriptional regulator)